MYTPAGTPLRYQASDEPLVRKDVLILLLSAGNVVQSLSFSSIVPLTIWAFTFDWPLLDPAPALGSKFVFGTGAIPIYLLHACTPTALLWLHAPGTFMDIRHQSRVWRLCCMPLAVSILCRW